MLSRAVFVGFLLIMALLTYNVLSMMWLVILQVCAIAGLLFIGSLFLSGQRESRRSDTWDDSDP